jgi:hypothetical protein
MRRLSSMTKIRKLWPWVMSQIAQRRIEANIQITILSNAVIHANFTLASRLIPPHLALCFQANMLRQLAGAVRTRKRFLENNDCGKATEEIIVSTVPNQIEWRLFLHGHNHFGASCLVDPRACKNIVHMGFCKHADLHVLLLASELTHYPWLSRYWYEL